MLQFSQDVGVDVGLWLLQKAKTRDLLIHQKNLGTYFSILTTWFVELSPRGAISFKPTLQQQQQKGGKKKAIFSHAKCSNITYIDLFVLTCIIYNHLLFFDPYIQILKIFSGYNFMKGFFFFFGN